MSTPTIDVTSRERDYTRFIKAKLRPGIHPRATMFRFSDYLASTRPGITVDLSQPRFLPRAGFDPRIAIQRQGMGDCAAWAAVRVAYAGAMMTGFTPSGLMHPNVPYYLARMKEGTWPQDAGSYPEDDLNAIINGAPLLSAQFPYDSSPGAKPPQALLDGTAPRFDWLFAFRNAYSSDPGFLETIWLALDAGLSIEAAYDWPREWFDPHGGTVPNGVPRASSAGGHAIDIWGIVPATMVTAGMPGCYVLHDNQWGDEFSTDAAGFGNGQCFMRAGSFGVHSDYLTGANPRCWYIQVCTPEQAPTPPTPPNPEPGPQPEPGPTPPPDGYQRAVGIVRATEADMATYAGQKPKSIARRWWALGGLYVQQALEAQESSGQRISAPKPE